MEGKTVYFDRDYASPNRGGVPFNPGMAQRLMPWNAKRAPLFDTERSPGLHWANIPTIRLAGSVLYFAYRDPVRV